MRQITYSDKRGFSHIKTMVIGNGAYISTEMREFKYDA
jgi:hypothetical protein